MDAKAKELAQQVQETKEGITPKQLEDLINADIQQPNQAAAEPAPAPTPSAPAVTPAQAEPAQGQPDVLNLIPEKFRAGDVPTSLSNIAKSYADLETELKKQKDETANLNKLVQSFIEKGPEASPAPIPTPRDADVDDQTFFERPTEAVKKIAAQMAAAQIIAYHAATERQKYVEAFKTSHPDFESYREDIMAILKTRPDLDKDERNLPMVYELGKKRYVERMSMMRRELGLESTPTPTPVSTVDVDAIKKAAYQEALANITDQINKRKAASGIQGASSAVTPDTRVQPRVKEQALSPDEQIMQDMLNSGPKKLSLNLGE
jgi:hypothetical protein